MVEKSIGNTSEAPKTEIPTKCCSSAILSHFGTKNKEDFNRNFTLKIRMCIYLMTESLMTLEKSGAAALYFAGIPITGPSFVKQGI